jgi:hypothetical protein
VTTEQAASHAAEPVAAPAPTLPTKILAQASVLPGVLVAGWLLAALPLLLVHIYRPVPAIILGLILAGVMCRPAIRVASVRARTMRSVPWWSLVAVVGVISGFSALAYVTSAGDVLVRRDPGSYAMSALWLSKHGTIDMSAHFAAFGGKSPDLIVASQGFYQQGSHIIPQFMTGVPALLSIGGWLDGISGILHANAIVGAFALLTFAGLVARLVGPRWAPLGVLGLALVQPELLVMRAAYSEPAGLLIFLCGLVLVLDAMGALGVRFGRAPATTGPVMPDEGAADAGAARWALLIGGVVLGLVTLVRIDAFADLAAVVPFLALLIYHGVRAWRPLALGIGLGLLAGIFDGVVFTLPYVKHVGGNLYLILAVIALAASVCAVLMALARRGRLDWVRDFPRLPGLTAFVVVLGGLAFVVRPYVQTMRSSPTSGGAFYVEEVQRSLGMTIDPTRSYYEDAARWLSWYVGWATLAIALATAAFLAYEMVQGRRREWMLPLFVFLGTAGLDLFRPSITPDHPWADRRFVPVVLPGVMLLAVAAIRFAVRWLDQKVARVRSWHPESLAALQTVVVVALAAIVLVPTYVGSRHVIKTQTEAGEVDLVHSVCAQVQPHDVVLMFGGRGETEWPGTMRIMCGVPTAYLADASDPAALAQVAASVKAAGGRVRVLVSSDADRSAVPGNVDWPSTPTATLNTDEVGHTLVTRPDKTSFLPFQMWLGTLVS